MEMKNVFNWDGFTDKDFDTVLRKGRSEESDIYGAVYVSRQDGDYIVDVNYDNYPGEKPSFDLEVYRSTDDGCHGKWLGAYKKIHSSSSYQRFVRRAEKGIASFIDDYTKICSGRSEFIIVS